MAEQTLAELFASAARDIKQIVTDTIQLAKAELAAQLRKAGIAAGLFALAAGLLTLVILTLTFAYAYGLVAAGLPVWAAFLIVAGSYLIIAALAVFFGVRLVKSITPPQRTIDSVKATMAAVGATPPHEDGHNSEPGPDDAADTSQGAGSGQN